MKEYKLDVRIEDYCSIPWSVTAESKEEAIETAFEEVLNSLVINIDVISEKEI